MLWYYSLPSTTFQKIVFYLASNLVFTSPRPYKVYGQTRKTREKKFTIIYFIIKSVHTFP